MAELRQRYGLDHVAILSANESPFGPFPEVIDALRGALGSLNRYPDGGSTLLRDALAERLGVSRDNLVIGNGSCELLMLLGRGFSRPREDTLCFRIPRLLSTGRSPWLSGAEFDRR